MSYNIKLVKAVELKPCDIMLVNRPAYGGCITAEVIKVIDRRDTRDMGEVFVKTDNWSYSLFDDALVPVVVAGAEASGEVLRLMGMHRCPYCNVGTRTYLMNDETKRIVALCDHPHCGKISAALFEASRKGVSP